LGKAWFVESSPRSVEYGRRLECAKVLAEVASELASLHQAVQGRLDPDHEAKARQAVRDMETALQTFEADLRQQPTRVRGSAAIHRQLTIVKGLWTEIHAMLKEYVNGHG
jgi:hypothetical protein